MPTDPDPSTVAPTSDDLPSLMRCEAYAIAKRFFRRAVGLNPYEPLFTVHLALSLREEGRVDDAVGVLRDLLAVQPGSAPAASLLARYLHSEQGQPQAPAAAPSQGAD